MRGTDMRRFGSKQPTKASQLAAFRMLICAARDLDKLPSAESLSRQYRVPVDEVAASIRAERERRHG